MQKHLLILIALCIFIAGRAQQPILWGMTTSGGQAAGGAIFDYNSGSDTENVVHSFGTGTDGSAPTGSLIKSSNGLLYGMTEAGGAVNFGGILFSYNIFTGQETDLHDFTGSDTDGYGPTGSLIQLSNGLLYGMSVSGGLYNGGIIFSYNINTGQLSDLYDFGFAYDADQPDGSLMQASDSMLYGMSFGGGLYGIGTIFRFDISNDSETAIWSFGNDTDGYRPYGNLIQANNGLLYGMTSGGGGTGDTGIIFSFNIATDTEIVVHNFAGGNDGASPMGSLMQATDSLLYGMTADGGGNGAGTIFSYNTVTGRDTVLWSFGRDSDGINPQGSLIQASNGLLYGMAVDGLGPAAGGIIFSYNITTGLETILHNFGSQPGDGILPNGDLLEDDEIPVQFDLQCNDRDQHSLYLLIKGMGYYRVDSIDTHPTNPVYLGADTLTPAGISINNNLDSASGEMTMYMCNLGTPSEYYYWDNAYWKDTHHNTGNPDAVNPGGTEQYIFNLDAVGGIVYRYDGTGNGTQLIAGLATYDSAVYDVATDMNGNFYIDYMQSKKILCYNPDGIPIDTFTVTGNANGAGFAILGSTFYVSGDYSPAPVIYMGTLTGKIVNFVVIDSLPIGFLCIDMASCPNAANPLAVFEVPEAPHFIIYPNPASDKAIIKMDNTATIEIFNSLGQKIFTADTHGLTQYQLSVAQWPHGVYFVRATSGSELVGNTTLVVQ